VRIRREYVLPMLLVVALVAAILASYPWFVLSVMGVAYLGSIPFSYRAQQRFAEATDDAAVETAAGHEIEDDTAPLP
jgi:CDP-diacylglycerol--serine O-phosphatidyltransferase